MKFLALVTETFKTPGSGHFGSKEAILDSTHAKLAQSVDDISPWLTAGRTAREPGRKCSTGLGPAGIPGPVSGAAASGATVMLGV